MPSPPATPALCRLCRRPLASAAAKCPACGARQAWDDRARGLAPPRGRGWRTAAYVFLAVILVAAALVWIAVLRQIGAPILSDGGTANAGRPTSAECAQLATELTTRARSDQPIAAPARERMRQCFKAR